jgi:hypothetical protein
MCASATRLFLGEPFATSEISIGMNMTMSSKPNVWETVQTRLEPLKEAIDHEISPLYRSP